MKRKSLPANLKSPFLSEIINLFIRYQHPNIFLFFCLPRLKSTFYPCSSYVCSFRYVTTCVGPLVSFEVGALRVNLPAAWNVTAVYLPPPQTLAIAPKNIFDFVNQHVSSLTLLIKQTLRSCSN